MFLLRVNGKAKEVLTRGQTATIDIRLVDADTYLPMNLVGAVAILKLSGEGPLGYVAANGTISGNALLGLLRFTLTPDETKLLTTGSLQLEIAIGANVHVIVSEDSLEIKNKKF